MAKQANNNKANRGFEAHSRAAADKLRGNVEPCYFKHVALRLIFPKYISDAIEAKWAALINEDLGDLENQKEYRAKNIFRAPKEARWSHVQARAKMPRMNWKSAGQCKFCLVSRQVVHAFQGIVRSRLDLVGANIRESRTFARPRDLFIPNPMPGEMHLRDVEHVPKAGV